MRERDIMYLSELIENRIISYCIKEEGSLQEHLNIGEELAHRAMIQALHNIVGRRHFEAVNKTAAEIMYYNR